ncbi:MAG: L,D-transpeptidase [Solirubrobacterales bacterium]|nr:L,D-transpeptidase [Solirubrobacterales bacterium]
MRLRSVLVLSLVLAPAIFAASASAQEPATPTTTVPEATTAPAADPGAPAEAAESAEPDPAAGGAGEAQRAKKGGAPQLQPTSTKVRLKGLRGGKVTAGNRIKVAGTVRPFHAGQKVTIVLYKRKKTIKRKTVNVRDKGKGSQLGQFHWSRKMTSPGMYRVQAILRKGKDWGQSKTSSRNFRIRYPSLKEGNHGSAPALLNDLLNGLGYVSSKGSKFTSATGRAVLAYRKVNNMARKEKATSGIFKKLAKGKGGFKLKHPGAGKHVEADLSRQVMVLADNGKVDEIYTISSGAPATPTIKGKFRFYRKDAGYNSLGMYYSVYFIRGYATHGYHSVPTYPASHGCLRNPIPDSVHIYNWIDLGDPIYVYS